MTNIPEQLRSITASLDNMTSAMEKLQAKTDKPQSPTLTWQLDPVQVSGQIIQQLVAFIDSKKGLKSGTYYQVCTYDEDAGGSGGWVPAIGCKAPIYLTPIAYARIPKVGMELLEHSLTNLGLI